MNFLTNKKYRWAGYFVHFVFLAILCLQPLAAQPNQSEKITIQVQNQPVEKIFKEISEKTGLKFFYGETVLKANQSLSLNFRDASLSTVLAEITKQAGLHFDRTDNTISVSKKAVGGPASSSSQSLRPVSGVIVDENGEPVIGANIVIKGTTNGTVTDLNGKYAIEAGNDDVLLVSYIGYLPQEIKVGNKTVHNLKLQVDAQNLEEVVVVGYGTMKKKDLMGAASVLSGENLATNSNISVGGALQGKMSGMSVLSNSGFPGAETSIKIRGVGTFGSGSDSNPLIIIDGVPVTSGFETLNPGDIETVNVLKDASSAAIYGSRAANGVILISTKKGSTGAAKVSVNATWGMQTASNIMDLLTAEEFVSAIQEMRDNKQAIDGGNPTTKFDGIDPSTFGKGTKWSDYIYSSAPTYNINTSVSGGGEKTRYYLSAEYLNQDGIAINTGFQKASLRANIEGQVNSRLTIGNNVHLAYRNTKGSKDNRYSDVIFNAPIIPAYDADGSYGEPDPAYTSSKNAIAEVGWNTPTNDNYRVLDNLFVEYKFTDWLKFRFNGGIDMVYSEDKAFMPLFSDGGQTNNQNSYSENRQKEFMWVTDYLLYFDKVFGKHTINAMGGFSQQLFSKDNLKGVVKDFVSEVDNMHVINGGTNSIDRTLEGGKSQLALASWFGRVNYDYAGRYLFSVNLRADGSSRFKGGERWGVFPSFSGAWRISEEDFFSVKSISSLKLRASWGQLGNQSIGSWYPTIAAVESQKVMLGNGGNNQILYYGYSQTALSNRKLKWETTTMTNIGLDLGLLNGKLFMTADYFIKSTDGILRSMVLPLSVGMTAPNVNYAKVQNRGFDLEVGYNGKVRDFTFSVSGNVSFLHNEIKKLSEGVTEEVTSIGSYGGVTINRVGEPVDALYGYKTGGVITTQEEADKYKAMGQGNAKIGRLKYVDLDGNGKIDSDDRTILGSYIPKVSAGLTLSADWKGFDFNAVFAGVFGRKQHAPMSFQNRFPNRNMSRHWYDNRWTLGADPEGKYPALIQSESYEEMTDLMVANTSFVKLRSLTLGYTVPVKSFRTRVFVSGENLFTIHSKSFDGFDPENGNGVGHYTNWGDDFPTPRIFLVGLNLTF